MIRFVRTCHIQEGDMLALPVESASGTILLAPGVELNAYYVERLESMGFFEVYVTDGDIPDLNEYQIVSPETRRLMLSLSRRVYDGFQKTSHRKVFSFRESELERAMERLLAEVKKNRRKVVGFADVKSVDEYIYHHAVNVSIYALLVGLELKYTHDMLIDLGIGAMLLDVGKMLMSRYLLEKKEFYTSEEYGEMKEHTSRGFDFLSGNRSLKASVITLQHHERIDGSGYPRGLTGDRIHNYAKIVGIADVYDALTSNTTFRKRILPCKAVEYLQNEGRDQFDPLLLKHFTSHIALYPIGVQVELSNGAEGVVTGYAKEDGRTIVTLVGEHAAMGAITLDEQRRIFIRNVKW